MKTACIVSRLNHSKPWADAFRAGLLKHGWKVSEGPVARQSDLLVLWGVRNKLAMESQRNWGGKICVLERGYLGDRFAWTSVSFGGGLNGRGVFHGPFADASRWEKNFAALMQPWRAAGGYALILGQVTGDMSVKNVDIVKFWQDAARQLKALGYTVKFRPHPSSHVIAIPGIENITRGTTLAEDLAGAAIALNWNSNSGVDAVLAGVPTITMDKGSMAWDVTGHAFETPPAPEREPWARALAWKQYRLEEMASGECWANVGGAI